MSSSYRLREDPNDQRIALETNELMGGEDDDEEATDFANYVESDDDDEDPYFMPEHNKKSSTLTFSRLTCSPVQLVRFLVPAFCILVIIVYTTVIAVLTHKRRLHPEEASIRDATVNN